MWLLLVCVLEGEVGGDCGGVSGSFANWVFGSFPPFSPSFDASSVDSVDVVASSAFFSVLPSSVSLDDRSV